MSLVNWLPRIKVSHKNSFIVFGCVCRSISGMYVWSLYYTSKKYTSPLGYLAVPNCHVFAGGNLLDIHTVFYVEGHSTSHLKLLSVFEDHVCFCYECYMRAFSDSVFHEILHIIDFYAKQWFNTNHWASRSTWGILSAIQTESLRSLVPPQSGGLDALS